MTTETLTARLARLQDPEIYPKEYLYELARAYESGELIALDVPENGEPARMFVGPGCQDADQEWSINDSWGVCEECGATPSEYIAVSAISSALRAEYVAGMRDAAVYSPHGIAIILDAAAKLESGQ